MASPRAVEVPTPNLVPTLILKQAKRKDFIEKNAELEFSYRRPQSEAASALASGTGAFLRSGRSSKGTKSSRSDQDIYAALMAANNASKTKRKTTRKSNRKKKSKNKSVVQNPKQTETVSPKISKNLFFVSLDKRIYPDRRLKIVKKKKEHKDIHVYAPRIKKTLPSLEFDQAGILGRRMFKELMSDVEQIKNEVEVSKLGKHKPDGSNMPNSDVSTEAGKCENNPKSVAKNNDGSKGGPVNNNEKQISMNNNFKHITHSSKAHQIVCSLCLDEFQSMQKFKVHQKYSCKERLVKCHNPCCNEYVPLCRMEEHVKYECRWVKYTDVVINENKDSHGMWPKVKLRTI